MLGEGNKLVAKIEPLGTERIVTGLSFGPKNKVRKKGDKKGGGENRGGLRKKRPLPLEMPQLDTKLPKKGSPKKRSIKLGVSVFTNSPL